MWNIAHQFTMKLFIIFAICYVASGQVKRLHVGATLNGLEEPRQRRLLQEADEPEIITVPRPGEEFVFISAGNNQKRGRFLEESKKKHHQSVSLFQAPSSVETGFKGVDLSSNIAKTELKSEASEQISIKPHSVSLFEAPESFDAGSRGIDESVDIIKREAIKEDSTTIKGPISSRTVVKTSPNGKEYEYEYLYYYDDSEEESEEEYEDVEEKQTTTTTSESPTTRPKRVRGKTTTEPTSENAPKVSNSRGQLFVQQQSILNKSPITNLRDNSIARAIKTEPKIEKSFETSSEEIDLNKDTFKKLSVDIENENSEFKEEEINMEILGDSLKQNQATVQGINDEAVKVSLNREDAIQKTQQDSSTINIILKNDETTETQMRVLQQEDANDKKTEELNVSNNDESREDLIDEEQHTAVEDAEIAHSAQAQVEKAHEDPHDIKPMIIHAEMMNEDEFKKKQKQEEHENTEPTIKPFDLENDIAKPTSSTPDEMSEVIPTEAPEFERILPGTRFPARIQAKIEMMTKNADEIIREGSADQEKEQDSNGPDVQSSQNREIDDQNEELKKEIDGIEREASLSDDENLVETSTENQSIEKDETLGDGLLNKEIEGSDASDQDVNEIVAKAEKTILETSKEAIQSNRINDSRAIHNLLVISQALNNEKDESSSEKEVKDDHKSSEATEKTRQSETRTPPPIIQTTSDSDATEATAETTTTKTKRTRFGGIRTRAPFFISRSTTRQADIPQTEGEETSTTTRALTTRFNRFGSRRKPTRTPTRTENVFVVESRDDQSESTTQSALIEQTKQTRGRFRPNLFRGEQRRRKPISGDAESVTVPITFEIKRQRPILPTRSQARVSPLSRRQKTTTTTEVIDLLAEMEATESPEESITLFELKEENEIIKTSAAPNVIHEEVQEEITLRPLRRRPSIPVGERPRKPNISPVAARRLSILGRRRTTTTSPELSEEEEGNESKIEDVEKEEVVEHESEHHHEPELEESEPEPVPETTTQATRLSILERNKLRRFRAKSTL